MKYNPCPRYPEGTTWEVGVSGRFGSCCWNMVTFQNAVKYIRDQYEHAVRDSKARRHAGDEYAVMEFRGFIDGPGGRLDWNTLRHLVTC